MTDLVHRLQTGGAILLETIVPGDEQPVVWLFEQPRETLCACTAEDLDRALLRLDEVVAGGAYAAGYVAYEAGYALEPAAGKLPTEANDPLLWFGVYGPPLVLDETDLAQLSTAMGFSARNPRFAYTRDAYAETFGHVRSHIFEGDTYQVNLTGPLTFEFEGSPIGLFDAMRRRQRRTLGAFINGGDRYILSRSPELFFSRHHRRMRTRPMKGTAARGLDVVEDEQRAQALRRDPKSMAENLMIVDLLRNDLSVVCEPGSVHVPSLFETERHETLIQMTSVVEGRLREGTTYHDIFKALFPCGSVTGAPRIRAMQVIQRLEPGPRGVYCGAIGWMGPDEEAVFNVAIRTAEIANGIGRLGIGSGIVWDSDEQAEYEECLLKADFFLRSINSASSAAEEDLKLIETMRWEGSSIQLLPLHLQRMQESAVALGHLFDLPAIRAEIAAAVADLPARPHRVRLLLDRAGTARVTVHPLEASDSDAALLGICPVPVRADDPMRRHKSTRRSHYEATYQAGVAAGVDEVVLLNERGEVAEGTRSNILIRSRGALLTPPVSSGALPGVYRAYLLQTREDVRQQTITLADLLTADQIFICNAVRGIREARLARDSSGRLMQVGAGGPDPESQRLPESTVRP